MALAPISGPEVDPGQAGETMTLGWLRNTPGRAGRSVWGEGNLGITV